MKLTNGALSMLLKRYRAVLFKCRSLNWLAGMVLAGGIVLGGEGLAMADPVAYTPENETISQPLAGPITLGAGDTIAPGTYTLSQAPNFAPSDQQDVTVEGQTIKIGNYAGLIITSSSGSSGAVTLQNGTTFTGSSFAQTNPNIFRNSSALILVKGGATLNVSAGVTFSKNTLDAYGVITSLKPSGASIATINLNGSATGPQIVFSGNTSGGAGAAVSNFAKATMTVGNVFFESNTVTSNKGGAGGGAVFMGAESTNLIAGATFTGNKAISANGAWGGAIATRDPDSGNMHDGTLTIGNSTFKGNYATQRGGAIYNAFYNDFDGYGTTLTTAPSGITTALIDNSTFSGNQVGQGGQGGAIYNDGKGDKTTTTYTTPTPAKLTISNSTFTNNSAEGGQGGALWNSGELTLINDTFSGNTASQGGDIYNAATGVLNVAGGTAAAASITSIGSGIYNLGTINIAQYAQLTGNMSMADLLATGTGSPQPKGQVNITTGGALLITGTTPSTLDLSQIATAATVTTGTAGKLTIQNTGASTIFVNDLVLTNTAGTAGTAGTMALGNAGTILGANKLSIATADGIKLTQGIINIQGAGSTLGGTGPLCLDGTSAVGDAKLNLGVDSSGQNVQATGGTIQTNVTLTKGTMTVSQGNWSLAAPTGGSAPTVEVTTNGYLVIGSAGKTATLDVQNGTFKNAASYSADTSGTSILNGGTLVIKSSQLLSNADAVDANTLSSNITQAFNVAQGGMVNVTGYKATDNKLVLSAFTTLHTAVMGSTSKGMLNLEGVSIVAGTGKTFIDGTATATTVNVSNSGAVLGGTVAVDASSTAEVTGGYAAEGLVLDGLTADAGAAVDVTVNGNVTLLGGGENGLISGDHVDKGVAVTLKDGQSLNLGLANDPGNLSKGGTLNGSVTLGAADGTTSSALNSSTAAYTITGNVNGDGSNAGAVTVNGGSLTIQNTGGTDPGINDVASVTLNGGTLTVGDDEDNGGIKTQALTASNGTITANGAIEVAGSSATTISNATVQGAADGNDAIKFTNSAITLTSGTLQTTAGNIVLGSGQLKLFGAATPSAANPSALLSKAARGAITPSGSVIESGGNVTASGAIEATGYDNEIKATGSTGTASFSGAVTVNQSSSLNITAPGAITLAGSTLNGTAGTNQGILNIESNAGVTNDTNALQVTNIIAGGDVTSGPAITATGTIQATGGDIKTTSGAITAQTLIATATTAAPSKGNINSAAGITANTINAAQGTVTTQSNGNLTASGPDANFTAKLLTVAGKVQMENGGTLTLGDEAEATATTASTAAGLTLNGVTANLLAGDKLTSSGANSITGGSFTAAKGSTVDLGSAATTIAGGAEDSFDTLTSTGAIQVGAAGDTKSSILNVSKAYTGTGALTLGGSAKAPAIAAIKAFSTTPADAGTPLGDILVANNAVAALGVADASQIPGTVDPANGGLYVGMPITLSGKGIALGGDSTTPPSATAGQLTAGTGSSTVIDASKIPNGTAAITGNVVADGNAKLMISGAQVGDKIQLVDANSSISEGTTGAGQTVGWDGANLVSDNPLIQFSGNAQKLEAKVNSASNFLPEADADTAAMLNSAASQLGPQGMKSPQRGIAFLSSALAMLNSSALRLAEQRQLPHPLPRCAQRPGLWVICNPARLWLPAPRRVL